MIKKAGLYVFIYFLFSGTINAQSPLWEPISQNKTTTPVARENDAWQKGMAKINYKVQNAAQADVLFIGDSIIRRWLDSDKGRPVWDEFYTDRGIYALRSGVSGDRVQHILYRNLNGNLSFKNGIFPKVVVFQMGTNNISGGDNPQAIADGIRVNLQLIRRRLPYSRIILTGIFPRVDPKDRQKSAKMIRTAAKVNQIISKYIEKDMVAYIDCGESFLNPDGKNVNPKYIIKDGVHITTAAYRIWAETLDQKLKEFLKAPPVKNIRIMLLGNSITSTLSDKECYRRYLDLKLHQAGLKFDFVGGFHKLRNESREPVLFDYDYDHEGHWAKEADWVLARIGGYARSARPDLVMMHIGTNDILHENGSVNEVVNQTLNDISNIIDTLRSVNPNIKILMAKIIPTKRGGHIDKKIVELNNKLPHLAAIKFNKTSPIEIVDQWSGMDAKTDLADSYHVNYSGAIKMTNKWFDGIQQILRRRSVEAVQIKLPNVLSDNMVLQRNSTAPIWGQGKAGQKFSVFTSWNNKEYKVNVDNNGQWRVDVRTTEAGGPYRIEIRSDSVIVLKNILLGEVWLCSGQSNMQMALRGSNGTITEGSLDEIAMANDPEIRLFTVGKSKSREPLQACGGRWDAGNPEVAAQFSAVAWFFGRYLHETLGVPIGLIESSVGGTPAQAWTPEEYMKNFDQNDVMANFEKSKREGQYPAALYNGMINPLIPYNIKGVIWYQGESNTLRPHLYYKLFPTMIRSWREKWGYEFPFYFVQIAPFGSSDKIDGAIIREAQLQTMLTVPNTGMAVTLDIGEERNIHPSKKKEVGRRLAYWALANTYGQKGVSYTAPVYDYMAVKDSSIILNFKHTGRGFENTRKNIEGFEIAGQNRVFYPANAQRLRGGRTLKVWSNQVKEPIAVRYCFKNWSRAALFGINGLPVSSFRTDDWK